MNSVTPCEACGHELRFQPDGSGRALCCPACRATLRVPAAPARAPLRGRRLGLVLLGVVAVSLPAAFGAATMRWSATPPPAPGSPLPQALGKFSPMPPGRDVRSFAGLLAETPPPRVDPHLAIPTGIDARLELPDDGALEAGLRPAGRLPAGLAFASDARRGLLFSAGADGILHWNDAETLRFAGSCRLPGAAYQLALDGERHLLYAALCSPGTLQLGPLGDRHVAGGDLHVFDLDRLLALAPTATAQSSKVIACGGHVWSMHLSPDRGALHYLAETRNDVRVVRVDLLGTDRPKTLEMRSGGAHALAPTPDGKALYGLAGGRLFAVDVADWSLRWSILAGGNILDLAAGPAGQLYLAERRHTLHLLVVDPETRRVVSRTDLGVEGRPYLRGSADGRRVYFSNSAVTSGRILAFEADEDAHETRLAAWARSDRTRLIRGGVRLSGDGRFLLTGAGQLFRVGS